MGGRINVDELAGRLVDAVALHVPLPLPKTKLKADLAAQLYTIQAMLGPEKARAALDDVRVILADYAS